MVILDIFVLSCFLFQSANGNWVTKASSGESYPTRDSFPETAILDAKGKASIAIAFGGGGVSAYSNTIGILAALNKLDLIKNVRYIGGVSGGAWASAGFTYDQTGVSDDIRLCDIVAPENFGNVDLSVLNPNCLLTRVGTNWEVYGAYLVTQGYSSQDAYMETTYNSFFRTLKIQKNVSITYDDTTLKDIRTRNPSLQNVKFYLPTNKDRPFLVINAALIGPNTQAYPPSAFNITNYEFSSLYFGSAKKLRVAHKTIEQTGGFVETYAFGGTAPSRGLGDKEGVKGTLSVPEIAPSDILGLPIMAGLSSFAPGLQIVSNIITAKAFGFTYRAWSPSQTTVPKAIPHYFSDGGNLANQDIISFLQRKVKNIILVLSPTIPLQPPQVWNVTADPRNPSYIAIDFMSYFGALPLNFVADSLDYSKNQVFSFSEWTRVVKALQVAQAKGNGIVATFALTTVKNSWWGIPAGFQTKVTIMYTSRVKNWEQKLPPSLYADLVPPAPYDTNLGYNIQTGPYAKFPNEMTTSGGPMSATEASLKANLASWVVLQNLKILQPVLSSGNPNPRTIAPTNKPKKHEHEHDHDTDRDTDHETDDHKKKDDELFLHSLSSIPADVLAVTKAAAIKNWKESLEDTGYFNVEVFNKAVKTAAAAKKSQSVKKNEMNHLRSD